MTESKTYICDSNINNIVSYDMDRSGIIYRPYHADEIEIGWRDIAYIEDRPHNRVVISLNNSTEVPIHYTTNDFPEFLEAICLKLSEIRQDNFRPQKFILNFRYLCQLGVVILLLLLSLIVSLAVSKILFILFFILIVPLVIFFQHTPVSLALENDQLVLLYLFKETSVNYNEISAINFAVVSNDYGRTLHLEIHIKNQNRLAIKKFGDMIILFIMLQIKLNEKKIIKVD